jgi:hypothetical protein
MPKTTRINPSWVLPTSPMKILALGQFQHRKPAIHTINKIVERFQEKTKNTAQIIIASTEANPSTPSIKLKRFMNQTIPIMVRGYIMN